MILRMRYGGSVSLILKNVDYARPLFWNVVLHIQAQQLEYLTVKFGESSLSMCEVMMKDAMESKRVDALIHGENEGFKVCWAP